MKTMTVDQDKANEDEEDDDENEEGKDKVGWGLFSFTSWMFLFFWEVLMSSF